MNDFYLARAYFSSELGDFNVLISENEISQINILLGVEVNQNNKFILKYKALEYTQLVLAYLHKNIRDVQLIEFSIDNNIDLNKFYIHKFNINPQLSLNLACVKQNSGSKLLIYKFFSIFNGVPLPKVHNCNIREHINNNGTIATISANEYLQNTISNIKYLKINFNSNDKVLSLYFNELAFCNILKLFANKILAMHNDTNLLFLFNNIEKSIFLGNIVACCIKSYLESILNIEFQIGTIEFKKLILSDCLLLNIESDCCACPIYVDGFNNFEMQVQHLSNPVATNNIINMDTLLSLGVDIGSSKISSSDLFNLKNGDIILLDETYDKDVFCINLEKVKFFVKLNKDENKLYYRSVEYI